MRPPPKLHYLSSPLKEGLLCVGIVLVATTARMALTPLFSDQYPFITFFPAVAVIARFTRFPFAVASVFCGAVSAAVFFFHPSRFLAVPSSGDAVGLALFVLVGYFIAWLSKQERDAKEAATRTLDVLKHERSSAEEQAALLDLALDAIMALRPDGTIEFWNRGAEEMYGYTRAEAIGKVSHDLLKTVFPKPLELVRQELLDRGSWDGELVHTRADGKQIYVLSRWALRSRD